MDTNSIIDSRRSRNQFFGNAKVIPTAQSLIYLPPAAAKATPFDDEDANCATTTAVLPEGGLVASKDEDDDDGEDFSFPLPKNKNKKRNRQANANSKNCKPEIKKFSISDDTNLEEVDENSSTDNRHDSKILSSSGDEKRLQCSSDDNDEENDIDATDVKTTVVTSIVEKAFLAAQGMAPKPKSGKPKSAKSFAGNASVEEDIIANNGSTKMTGQGKSKSSRVTVKKNMVTTKSTPVIDLENDNSFCSESFTSTRSGDLAVEDIPLKELLSHSKRFPSVYTESSVNNLKAKYDIENDAENKLLLKAVIMKFGKFFVLVHNFVNQSY